MIDKGIKNIIFDLGGVILNIDYSKTARAFINLGITNFNELYTQIHASTLFDDLECGKIEPDAFVQELNTQGSVNLSTQQITQAWNAMLLNFPPERMELLKSLKTRYRTFLLSNTNAIHHKEFNGMLAAAKVDGTLEDYFEKAYYSHVIGYRKPNKEAYEFVLNDNNLKPEETMFIDDTKPNTDASSLLGIKSIYLQPPQGIETIFT